MASTPPQGPEADPWDSTTCDEFETCVASPSASAPLTAGSKSKSEFYDPCQAAAQRSYRCLYRNGGDKSMCGEFFQCVRAPGWTGWAADARRAYRECKQAWVRRLVACGSVADGGRRSGGRRRGASLGEGADGWRSG